jgi:hypothetical protein
MAGMATIETSVADVPYCRNYTHARQDDWRRRTSIQSLPVAKSLPSI